MYETYLLGGGFFIPETECVKPCKQNHNRCYYNYSVVLTCVGEVSTSSPG